MADSVKIDFLVPGFSKCGTTTLCALLARHPQLYMPRLKEPWYFSAPHYSPNAAGYARHFRDAGPGQLLGEGSQSYSTYQDEDISIERIREHNPDCRFIFMARNPLHRIESSYREMHHSGPKFGVRAPFGLSACLQRFPQIIRDSMYFERIGKYVEAFGAGAIMVVFLEDLQRQPQYELSRCFRHLGVAADVTVASAVQLNEGESKLHDVPLLRRLRASPRGGPLLARLKQEQQDVLLRPLGLRRPFKAGVAWDDAARAMVEEMVLPDAVQFLRAYGKPADFWAL